MYWRPSVRDGASLSAVGAGNIDAQGTVCVGGGWIGCCVFGKGFVGYSNGCIECR